MLALGMHLPLGLTLTEVGGGWQAAPAHVEAGRATSEAGSLIDLDLGQAHSTQAHLPGNLLNSSLVAEAPPPAHADAAAASSSNWSSFADVPGERVTEHFAQRTARLGDTSDTEGTAQR
jgi:hypothetical protein